MGAPVRLQKAVPGSKENAAVERREVNALRHWACAARRLRCYPRLSALRSPHVGEGELPLVSEGMEMPGAPRALREQGRRSFEFLRAGCLKCESEVRARKNGARRLPDGLVSVATNL